MAGRPSSRLNGPPGARERILDTVYELFSREGIRAVGIDRIIAESDVAKMTLYRHFASKQVLALAFLDLRRERWTCGWLEAGVEHRASGGRERALAIFELLDEWFHQDDFEGCSFINTLTETRDPASPVRQEAVRQLDLIEGIIEGWTEQAGVPRPRETAYQLQILMMGAIVSAQRGDLDAAKRMRPLAALLLESSRPVSCVLSS